MTFFSDDKPDRRFTVITFLIDAISGVALDLDTGLPCYQVEDEEVEFIYYFNCQSGRIMKAAGASGGPIRQALILVSAPITNAAFATARRVAMKMGRRLRCSSVTYQLRYAPLVAPCRRPILIATKATLVMGQDTGSIFDGALVEE